MDLGIQGKVALVLASSKGLGQAMAVSLAKEGARVVLTGRTVEALERTAKQIIEAGGRATVLPWDLHQLNEIDLKISQIEKEVGPVDILINNTGGPPPTSAANQSIELWQSNFNHLVLLLMKVTDRVLPQMKAKAWGRIITSTSSGIRRTQTALDAIINADVLLIMTPWSQFRSITAHALSEHMRGRIVIDPYRMLDRGELLAMGFSYITLGAPVDLEIGC